MINKDLAGGLVFESAGRRTSKGIESDCFRKRIGI